MDKLDSIESNEEKFEQIHEQLTKLVEELKSSNIENYIDARSFRGDLVGLYVTTIIPDNRSRELGIVGGFDYICLTHISIGKLYSNNMYMVNVACKLALHDKENNVFVYDYSNIVNRIKIPVEQYDGDTYIYSVSQNQFLKRKGFKGVTVKSVIQDAIESLFKSSKDSEIRKTKFLRWRYKLSGKFIYCIGAVCQYFLVNVWNVGEGNFDALLASQWLPKSENQGQTVYDSLAKLDSNKISIFGITSSKTVLSVFSGLSLILIYILRETIRKHTEIKKFVAGFVVTCIVIIFWAIFSVGVPFILLHIEKIALKLYKRYDLLSLCAVSGRGIQVKGL